MDHGIGGGQVEAAAAGLEADQEHRKLSRLEALYRCASVLGAAGQLGVGDLAGLQLSLDQRQHRGELREQQHAAAFVHQFLKHIQKGAELAGIVCAQLAVILSEQAQIAAALAQAQQRLEDDDMAARQALAGDFLAHLLVHRQAQGLVAVALQLGQLDPLGDLGLRRQFAGYLFLVAAQQEGADAPVQMSEAMAVAAFLDGRAVIAGEGLGVAEPTRHEEVEQ